MADLRLVNKGQGEPLGGLLQQGRVSVAVATEYATPLDDAGWPAENTALMTATIGELEGDAAQKADDRSGARQATTGEHAAIGEAKTFLRKLRNALPAVLRSKPAGVDASSFHAGVRLARSTPKISAHLLKIRPGVAKLDETLKPYFKKQSVLALLDQVKAALDNADVTQESTLSALPTQTVAVYEKKGKLLELIEDLNRAGQNAFDGNAAVRARFNKDVLLRARKQQAEAKAEAPAAPVEPAPVG